MRQGRGEERERGRDEERLNKGERDTREAGGGKEEDEVTVPVVDHAMELCNIENMSNDIFPAPSNHTHSHIEWTHQKQIYIQKYTDIHQGS